MIRSCPILVVAVFAAILVPHACAIDVVTTFVGGDAPQNIAGGGNLTDIFNAAAARWSRAYPENFTVRLYFGWAPTGSAGTHSLIERGGEPERELGGLILFDNSGTVPFYLDPTPFEDDEYERYTEEHQNLGGGLINVARYYTSPTGDAAGRCDLLSVAMHEIGHALGLGVEHPGFARETAGGAVLIGDQYPFAGTAAPLAVNNSGITSHFDALAVAYGSVMTGICSDERRIPSELDLLVNAQISGFQYFIASRAGSTQRLFARPNPEGRGFLR